MENQTLTLSEAAKLTGFSLTKFTTDKNKELLTNEGATTEGTGKNWKIPTDMLVRIGWLNEDGSPIPKRRGTAQGGSTRTRRSPLDVLEAEIQKAESDIERADALKKDATARLRDARKKVDAVKAEALAEARRKIEEGQAELARLESL